MRERVDALRGSLDAGPEPEGGWRLRARLPAADPPAPPAARHQAPASVGARADGETRT